VLKGGKPDSDPKGSADAAHRVVLNRGVEGLKGQVTRGGGKKGLRRLGLDINWVFVKGAG